MRTVFVWRYPVILLVGLAGCQWMWLDEGDSDSDSAAEVLTAALDAWKAGNVKSLTQREPPIRFADDDCAAGMQLVEYELEDEAPAIHPFQNVRIALQLKNKQGKLTNVIASYQVATEPALTVLRSNN